MTKSLREFIFAFADVAPARYALGPRFESPQWENPQRLRTDHYENVCKKNSCWNGN